VSRGLKDLKSDPAKVEKISSAVSAAAYRQDVMMEDVTNGSSNVKRNLFGTSPVESDELAASKGNSLSGVNFSFHSPVKAGETISDVSVHDSVSSALHQLPLLGDGDITMFVNDDECAYTEDDQWLENVSGSAWEGPFTEANQEVGGANTARILRRFIVQSVLTRQRMDLKNDESQVTTNNSRYLTFFCIITTMPLGVLTR